MNEELEDIMELEYQEKYKKPRLSWIDKLYHKTNTIIKDYLKEVTSNFNDWKKWMVDHRVYSIEWDYLKRDYVYIKSPFNPTYFQSKDYVRYRSYYQVYSKLAKNPTITEFVKFIDNWKDGVTRGFPKSGKVFSDFEDMFINVD